MSQLQSTTQRSRDSVVEAVHRSWSTVDRDAGVGGEMQFTEDGVCSMPSFTMTGRAEIARGYALRQANGPRLSRHLVSNLVVDVGEDRAAARYALCVYSANGTAPLPLGSPQAICDVIDDLVLIDDEWFIERRALEAVFVSPTSDSVMLTRDGGE